MSDEEKDASETAAATAAATEPSEPPFLDEHTTQPNSREQSAPATPRSPGKWEMPKPKFQQTSGYLPQGYLQDIQAAAETIDTAPSSGITTQETSSDGRAEPKPSPASMPEIEPQPDLSDQLVPEVVFDDRVEPEKAKGSGSRIPMILLGVVGILIFIVVFLIAVYFLFFAGSADS